MSNQLDLHKHCLSVAVLLAGIVLGVADVRAETELEISGAWIPEAPPVARMLAGYLEIENRGASPVAIVGARIEGFGAVEIHHTVDADGMSRMRRQDRVEIRPGERVALEPGGLHLMLKQPDPVPRRGDRLDGVLVDAQGREWPFTAEVRPR